MTCPWKSSSAFDSGAVRPRAIQSTASLTPGVEMTTGPLGQGFAHGVGMAIAERGLADHYNRSGHDIINHYTYAIVSDGDLQEGVSSEAASLAGTLRLGKLIYLYDDNDVSIEGDTNIAFAENVDQRFRAYGWHVIGPIDGMDPEQVDSAIRAAQSKTARPSLIVCQTVIGYGSPNKAGTASAHGEPLGEEKIQLTKQQLSWPYEEPFTVPPEALSHFLQAQERGRQRQDEWQALMDSYRKVYPEEAAQLEEALQGDLPEGWEQGLDQLFSSGDGPVATREASGRVMNAIVERVHAFAGVLRTWHLLPKPYLKTTGTTASRNTMVTTCTSASVSTPWGPSPTAWPSTEASYPTLLPS